MRLLGKSAFLGFEAATQQIFTAKHESHGTIGQQAIPPCPELQVTYNGGSSCDSAIEHKTLVAEKFDDSL